MGACLVALAALRMAAAQEPVLEDPYFTEPPATIEQPPAVGEVDLAPAPLTLESELTSTTIPALEGVAYADGAAATVRPVNWIAGPYFKAGPNLVIGGDVLEGNREVGYTIAGGYRQPLGPEIGGDRWFFDFGGSYLSAFGVSTENTSGLRTTTNIVGVVTERVIIDNAFSTTVKELRRGAVHAALGWYWGEPLDNSARDPQIRVMTRLGGRAGHVRGRFSPDVRLINPDPDPGENQTIETIYGKTDTIGGLFVSTEAVLLQRHTAIGHIQWTIDGELANDWIEFEQFKSGSLGSASIMTGFMLSR